MFTPGSRYEKLAQKTIDLPVADGETRTVRYVERRFIPPPEAGATLVEHSVTQDERLDQITARYLGDPTQFWRVADANRTLRPEELTADLGNVVRVALPQT